MAYISRRLRGQVTYRAKRRCEYCQAAQVIIVEMVIDHIVPEAVGGQTTLDNLCLAYVSCNAYKLDFQYGTDPLTGETIPLYNPRLMSWSDHFVWSSDGTNLIGITAVGRATIARLRINRDLRVQARQRWVQAGWHPPTED